VPTAQEAGYPSLNFDGLVGLFSTRELAEDARAKIAADIKAVAGDPDIVKKMTATAQIVSPGNAKEFAESIAQQKAQVAAVAKLFGNKPVQ
jgi:tripartite-type tricarboxylate transporter receptor subunit TctC